MWRIFFLTEYESRILFGFQKSLNTEYWILFGIDKILIPNTEYYSVLRKSKCRIWIVLFGLTIQIPNMLPCVLRCLYKVLACQYKTEYKNITCYFVDLGSKGQILSLAYKFYFQSPAMSCTITIRWNQMISPNSFTTRPSAVDRTFLGFSTFNIQGSKIWSSAGIPSQGGKIGW